MNRSLARFLAPLLALLLLMTMAGPALAIVTEPPPVPTYTILGVIDFGRYGNVMANPDEVPTIDLWRGTQQVGALNWSEEELPEGVAPIEAEANIQPVCPATFPIEFTAGPVEDGPSADDHLCLYFAVAVDQPGRYTMKAQWSNLSGRGSVTVVEGQETPALMPLIKMKRSNEVRPLPAPVVAEPQVTVVPPSLTLDQLPATTDKPFVLVTGTATPGSAVRIEVGGKEATTYHVGESGKFLVLAFLAPGENQIEAIATKDGGKTSVKATVTAGSVNP